MPGSEVTGEQPPAATRAQAKAEKQAARQLELAECQKEINALLESADAALDIAIVTTYRGGVAYHDKQITIIGR